MKKDTQKLLYSNLSNNESEEYRISMLLKETSNKLKMLADYIDAVDKKFVNGLQYGAITNLKEADDLIETIESFRKENCNEIELF